MNVARQWLRIRCSSRGAPTRRRIWILAFASLALMALALCSLTVGSRSIAWPTTIEALRTYEPRNDLHLIVWKLRIPRTIAAVLAGMALGVAGAIMQAVTRNPLAEPGLLGINAGAAVAVVLGVAIFQTTQLIHHLWFASLGAGLAGVAVFVLGRIHETGVNPVRLVLAGAGLSVMLGSIAGIAILNAPPTVFDHFRHWAAGSTENASFDVVTMLALSVALGLSAALSIAGALNAMALGHDLAQALGANLRRTWLLACLTVMLLAGAATASVGPIGFVGLVAPHIARGLTGPDHRWLLPCSALLAGILLLGADIIGRLVAAPSEIAAGIVAALIGGPFFLVIVRRFRLSKL